MKVRAFLSFSPELHTSADYIKTSLQILQEECAFAYHKICSKMVGSTLQIDMDEECIGIHFGEDEILVTNLDDTSLLSLRLEIDRKTILKLLDGNLSVLEAVERGILDVWGHLEDIIDLYDSLMIYFSGAVRCPSLPLLLDRFRDGSRN